MASSTVSSKGQVTIPLEVRTRLGLRAGDRVEFAQEDGKTVLKPMREQVPSFREYIGAFPCFKTREEINAWVREMREDDRTPE
jgi:AbrB family looped-hinge helix DNA binding protein